MTQTFQNQLGSDNEDSVEWVIDLLNQRDTTTRFWNKVQRSNDGCWLWTGTRADKCGHGGFNLGRRDGQQVTMYAHRIAWILEHGSIPHGKQINHRCDVPACVRPDHLYLGTQLDNMRDASTRGRFPKTRQPRKLSDGSVRAIRSLYAAGVAGVVLAKAFAVTRASISQIKDGHRRRYVNE